VTTIHEPQGENRFHFANQQEACRKDVENFLGGVAIMLGNNSKSLETLG
jgi:hypothetical protein